MVRHSSRIELSQSSLKGNINFLRKKIGSDTRVSLVVKANAYGHGISAYVPMAEKCGIDHFSVASSHEAEMVLKVCKPETRIMIMGILYEEDLEWAINHGIEFYVYNLQRLESVCKLARNLDHKARIHLEVETGANRTGVAKKEFSKCLTMLKKCRDFIELEGLCTHFAGAETFANDFKIQKQFHRFKEYYASCKKRGVMPKMRHLASSAAALSFAKSRFEMVRIGVAQYGFWPSPDVYYHHLNETNKRSEKGLRRIFSWKTDVMDVRFVDEGEFIGYGTAYQALRNMKVAVLPLGYSNGYPRGLSNRGQVLIRGKKAPITGLINMNLFMVDITHIPGVEVGDEVVLIGRQGNNQIGVASFTQTTQLRNQEMMSRLPAAIPRVAVR
ncbi:MAG: alanine racemase [Cryomorphaceae bacterium]|nr:alanine racemase [Flavobacteriales bacterium]